MSVTVPRGPQPEADDGVRQVHAALSEYVREHPGASAQLYRYGQYLIRLRVTDPRFAGLSRAARHEAVWAYLEPLPEEVLSELYTVVLLTPDEKASSLVSVEFDDPVPARL